MIKLEANEPHHWAPDQSVIDTLCERLPAGARVLEIGPGHIPFPRADTFVDLRDLPNVKVVKVDANDNPLPFGDNEFDFVYARHVLEDMHNPFMLCREMSRVAKAGYIETPSPLCEYLRGVDGGAPPWRGYNHHLYFVWPLLGTLYFLGKFPIVEHINFPDGQETQYLDLLRTGPDMWNTRFYWEGDLKYKHLLGPHDYRLPEDYQAMITRSVTDWHKDYKASLNEPRPWRK
jgi:hypothetical protein